LSEEDRATLVVEELKDMSLELSVPILAIVAAVPVAATASTRWTSSFRRPSRKAGSIRTVGMSRKS